MKNENVKIIIRGPHILTSGSIIHYSPMPRLRSLEENEEMENWKMRHLGQPKMISLYSLIYLSDSVDI